MQQHTSVLLKVSRRLLDLSIKLGSTYTRNCRLTGSSPARSIPELRAFANEEDDFDDGGYLMRRRIAQALAMALLVGWGAAQDPTRSGSAGKAAVADRISLATPGARPNGRAYQIGTASWYGEDFDGKPTASGEPFNMYDLTAAHPSLPLGTMVKVTNLRNRRAVVVRINDRGPIVPGRIIDVSYSAARALKFQGQGTQRVRLDVVPLRKPMATMAMLREPVLGK
jgi:rare lipoprotein A